MPVITVTVLAENTARGPGVLGEHGLAWWIDTGGHRVLFDTGQGLALEHNARALGIELARADAIVLSHGHYDHVGGLAVAMQAAPGAAVHLHPRAIEAKYSGSGGGSTARRISHPFLEQEPFRAGPGRIVRSAEPHEIVPGVWATGEVPRVHAWEDTGGPFFLDAAMHQPDPLLDDQAVFFSADVGLVVVLGCAHAGVINTLDHVAGLTGQKRIHMVLGGMHLERASQHRLASTIEGFRRHGVERLCPLHCTGAQAKYALDAAFGERCVSAGAGSRFSFGRP